MNNKKLLSFITKAKIKHGNKYDYSKVEYINSKTKVCIICPEHGEFWQTPKSHLKGDGCPICKLSFVTQEDYIKKACEVHNNFYDYSKVVYKNSNEKICIICPKHGKFYQKPCDHLSKQGCPICHSSHMETEIREFLIYKKVKFEEQKRFDWLGTKSLDFYIPSKNIAIECQGRQHFECSDFFGGEEENNKIRERDMEKKRLCEEHNVDLIYFSNLGITYPYEVLESEDILLKRVT